MSNILRITYVLPVGNEPWLCPQYESPEDDPISPCVMDAVELGEEGCVACWRSWRGPEKGLVCPFID
jgi:hypothetical protein